MRILITKNDHLHYDKVGEITGLTEGRRYTVRIPHKSGSIQTTVVEGEFKEIKQQDEPKVKPAPAGTLSADGRYQADGLGYVERVSSVERDWDDPAAHRGY